MYRGSCGTVNAGMAAAPMQGTPPVLSLRNGCRCASDPGVTVEELLLVVGKQVGFDNILSASRMSKAIFVFLTSESLVNQLTVSGIWVKEAFVPVTPLQLLKLPFLMSLHLFLMTSSLKN